MKVHDLRNVMKNLVPEHMLDKTVHNISHWVSKVYYEKEYTTGDEKEIKTLNKFVELGIMKSLDRNKFTVTLTEKGAKLYKEFESKGFFGSDTIKRWFSKAGQ